MRDDAHTFPPLLTVLEAAHVLRVSPRTLRRMLHAGEVPGVRLHRQYRVSGAWVAELVRDSGDPPA